MSSCIICDVGAAMCAVGIARLGPEPLSTGLGVPRVSEQSGAVQCLIEQRFNCAPTAGGTRVID